MTPEQLAELGVLRAAAWVVLTLAVGISGSFFWLVKRMATRIIDGDGNGAVSLRKVSDDVAEVRGEVAGLREEVRGQIASLPCRQGQVCHLHAARSGGE